MGNNNGQSKDLKKKSLRLAAVAINGKSCVCRIFIKNEQTFNLRENKGIEGVYMVTLIDGVFNTTLTTGTVVGIAAVAVLVTAALYALRSIGLFVMAKRAEIAHAFIAWIPLVWIYTACKLIGGKVKLFGKPINKLAIIFCIIYAASGVLNFVYDFLIDFPLVGNYLMGREISVLMLDSSSVDVSEYIIGLKPFWGYSDTVYIGADFVDPYGDAVYGIIDFLNVISWVSLPFDLAQIFVVVIVYVNLFKRYLPQHYMLATIVSLLGFFAPFVFAARKREPVNYGDYLRSRYRRYGYGPYGQQGPYYGNPYGVPPQGQNGQKPPEHPFSEFADKNEVDPGNPFKEFSDDEKDK